MMTEIAMGPENRAPKVRGFHSPARRATATRPEADVRFLYGLLFGLAAATLIAGSITAGLAAALLYGPFHLL